MSWREEQERFFKNQRMSRIKQILLETAIIHLAAYAAFAWGII